MNSQQEILFLQLSCQLAVEQAHLDLAIARKIIAKNRRKEVCRRARAKRFWVRSWYLHRPIRGQFRLLMDDLRVDDEEAFRNFTRMTPETFFGILRRIERRIVKQDTFWREAISPAHRLAVALRYFATGDTYTSMHFSWYMGDNTIGGIVRQVAEAIIDEYADEQLDCPTTTEGWLAVAEKFAVKWNFYNCLGALDGKHVAIKQPPKSGTLYHNYKKFFSIVLMALVDADYRFLWIDVGTPGSNSDAQIWNDCELQDLIKEDKLQVPADAPLPGFDEPIPYAIVGDDAFALRKYLIKPYGRTRRVLTHAERVFNYRSSRARRVVENAFGILANRFQCLHTTMRQDTKTVIAIVSACCILHNILRSLGIPKGMVDEEDADHQVTPGAWREGPALTDGEQVTRGNIGTREAKTVREKLTEYYVSPAGQVPWQDRMI